MPETDMLRLCRGRRWGDTAFDQAGVKFRTGACSSWAWKDCRLAGVGHSFITGRAGAVCALV